MATHDKEVNEPRGSYGTVACLLGRDFEDSELRIPHDRLRQAGYAVTIVGLRAGEALRGKKGKEVVTADVGIDDVQIDVFDGLLIPGGHSPENLRRDPSVIAFVKAFDALRRPLAAVCHGPQLLIAAGLVKGRTLTAWSSVQEELRQAGANVVDQEVVVDDNWVTSRKPADLEAFAAKFIEELGEHRARSGSGFREVLTAPRPPSSVIR
jgi:protease I